MSYLDELSRNLKILKNTRQTFHCSYVVRKPKNLSDTLREDIWNGIQKLKDRAVKIDLLKMIAVDMTVRVTIHLEKLRISNARA